MIKVKKTFVIEVVVVVCALFLGYACDTDKKGSVRVIKQAFMAANEGDVKTADRCLSRLDTPDIQKSECAN